MFRQVVERKSDWIGRCIPFKDTNGIGSIDGTSEKDVEVLMINSTSGPGLLFPKVFNEHFCFLVIIFMIIDYLFISILLYYI